MREIPYYEALADLDRAFAHGGAFASVRCERDNTMTIGWGALGLFWGKPHFVLAVRQSRHTKTGIDKTGVFTVSVPVKGDMAAQLAFAGRASGRDLDKFAGHGLTALPARKVDAPIVAECELHIECVVRLAQDMTEERFDANFLSRNYPKGDLHTMYYGEIVACYRTE